MEGQDLRAKVPADPTYGYFSRWPEDGDGWVHPEDIELARRLLPSFRIWRREGTEGPYRVHRYGAERLRLRPALWIEAPYEGFDVGDPVAVRSQLKHHDPLLGFVREVLWDEHLSAVVYQLERLGMPLAERYLARDLRHEPPTKLRPELRIEPLGTDSEFEFATE